MKKALLFVLSACLMTAALLNLGGGSVESFFSKNETAQIYMESTYWCGEQTADDQAILEAMEWLPTQNLN
ncbi:MAG: hypothetical protein IJM83_00980 [Firmicutes bacterium]|nr:hypothetical protein [Bacillota bacterium]